MNAALSAPVPWIVWVYALSLGAGLAFAAALVLRAFTTAPPGQGTRGGVEREPAPPLWRIGWHVIERLAPACRRVTPSMWQVRLGGQLREAGLELALSPAQFIAGQMLLAALTGLACLVVFGWDAWWLVGGAIALGWLLPALRLAERVKTRRRRIRRDLPVMLDLIGLGVQSGMTTALAISLAIERGPPGPLRDEFARTMREVKAGRVRQEALRAMADRHDVAGLRHALAAILTAERQGADLSPVLRAQSAQRREERFIDAERRAMQAPVKLLLPLVVFIFPGTFLILMFPIAMQVIADGFFS